MRTIFQEIIRYRGLIQTLVVRDLKARYRGSTLGLLWTLLNPLFHMAIYALVFSIYIRNDMQRYPAFLLCGILPWTWLSSALFMGTTTIIDGGSMLKKVFFPPQVLPTVIVIATFINFLLSLPLLFGVLLLFGVTFGWSLLALPLIMTAQFALTLGLTLIISAVSVRYRDIPPILGHVLMFWFFLTPIIYPVSSVPERFRALLAFNPVTPFFVAYQEALLYNRLVSWEAFSVMISLGAVVLLVGVLIFERLRWSLVEEV
jgi:homopolymeric O-antigen transport system permease protein